MISSVTDARLVRVVTLPKQTLGALKSTMSEPLSFGDATTLKGNVRKKMKTNERRVFNCQCLKLINAKQFDIENKGGKGWNCTHIAFAIGNV